jgi:hypothetical protein
MTTSSTTIDEKYNQAVQSLKRINNDLFYDDLKKLIQSREQTITAMNKEVYESIEKMQKSLKRFPMQVSEQLKEEVIDPQSELFDSGMERFNENLSALEKKMSLWHQQYQDYLIRSETLISSVKELQKNDHELILEQTKIVLEGSQSLQDQLCGVFKEGINDQTTKMSVKYEAISNRLTDILKGLSANEASHKAELEHWHQQHQQEQKVLQEKWEEKWKLSVDAGAKREELFKKWLIGLSIGQGVSIVLMVLFLILK